ncbi:MAG: hypothetical protein LUQ38_07755 [Methanotrichaceae archaeon]|nr:hypothetical protein [Methanotrichaceae archaeon]
MDEISESLALLHSIGMKTMEPSNDSGSVFARMINVTLRGWHEGKVAMKGKGVSEGLINQVRSTLRVSLHLPRDGIKGVGKGRLAQI